MTEPTQRPLERHVFDAKEADAAFNALIERVEAGETISLFRNHQLVAYLVPVSPNATL